LNIEGLGEVKVVNVIKVGKCVLHEIDKDVAEDLDLVGAKVSGIVDLDRRI